METWQDTDEYTVTKECKHTHTHTCVTGGTACHADCFEGVHAHMHTHRQRKTVWPWAELNTVNSHMSQVYTIYIFKQICDNNISCKAL